VNNELQILSNEKSLLEKRERVANKERRKTAHAVTICIITLQRTVKVNELSYSM